MSTHLAQLTLTFHEHLQSIVAAPTTAAKKAAEAKFAAFLRTTLQQVDERARDRTRADARRHDDV